MRKLFFSLMALLILGSAINPITAAVLPPAATSNTNPDPAAVKAAIEAFKSLPRKERKERIKLAKKEIKAFNAAKKAGKEADTNTLLLVILAILLPPLAVYLHQGEINNKFWISLLLTILFWLPGVIYALIVILGNG
jgi:uncharacterized membrane protein YqaE (UPF0057 family)